MKNLRLLLAASMLAFATISTTAMAIPTPPPQDFTATGNNTTFNFSATCFDCTSSSPGLLGQPSTVTGSIILQDYVLGTGITLDTFVSFSYAGPSNHVNPFTVSNGSVYISDLGGSLGGLSNSFSIRWDSDPYYFSTNEKNWSLGLFPLDFGNNIAFSQVSVPAPSSLALFGLGLVALAFRRKTKSKAA